MRCLLDYFTLRLNMNTVREIQYKPSLALQMLMFFNVYLSITWNIVYVGYIFFNLSKLYDLHGLWVIICYFICTLVEICRLRLGYKGNIQARSGDLCTFLILSPFVQLPLLLFLMLSAKEFVGLLMALTIALQVVMALEFVICLMLLWPRSDKNIALIN